MSIVADSDGRGGYGLYIDGVAHSHLEPADPRRLDFEYMRWIGDVLDSLPDGPLTLVHVGGGACTLPRYAEATRPGSRQVVFESDPEVLSAVRAAFGLRSSSRLRIRQQEGRAGLATLPATSQDVVIRDAFVGDAVPEHLRTAGFLDDVRRVLRPGGLYVANLADRPPLRGAREEAATVCARFARVALIGEPAQFKGRRHGNLVLLATDGDLPEAGLTRALASGAVRARFMTDPEVRGFAAAARPLEDAATG